MADLFNEFSDVETGARVEMTLSQLAAQVNASIRQNPYTQNVWVTAELSDVRISGGHCYMELIEKNESGTTVAKIRAAIWASKLYALRHRFVSVTGRDISSGLKVLLQGSLNHHPVYGLSLIINDIDPSYTLGDMERLRKEIILKLTKEGVVNYNKDLSLTEAPLRIAVISAAGAAGYGDFMRQLEANNDGFIFYPMLFPAIMQGEKTSQSIREALSSIEMSIDVWDCVAILRGGGATSDLNGFDDIELARAVATFPIPVIVGIGHERDRTVLDEIAHTRVKTPTAAAAFFIDRVRNSYALAGNFVNTILRYVSDRVSGEKRNLANLDSTILSTVPRLMHAEYAKLKHLSMIFSPLLSRRISDSRLRLQKITSFIPVIISRSSEREKSILYRYRDTLVNSLQYRFNREYDRIESIQKLLKVLSPSETLKRGYSITRSQKGNAVKSAADLIEGSVLTTTFFDGEIKSTVIEIKK